MVSEKSQGNVSMHLKYDRLFSDHCTTTNFLVCGWNNF